MGRRPEPVEYSPTNPSKYKGTYPIILRSSWEVVFAKKLDLMDDVIEWSSEPCKIPYTDPTRRTKEGTAKPSIYIPDFMATLRDASGSLHTFLIEVKPNHETGMQAAKNLMESVSIIRNQAKWAMASWWCQRRGITFKVIGEDDLFNTGRAPQPIGVITQKKIKKPPKRKTFKVKTNKPTKKAAKTKTSSPRRTGSVKKVSAVSKIRKTKRAKK